MDFDSGLALDHVLQTIKQAPDVTTGLAELCRHGESIDGASGLWSKLRQIPFTEDAEALVGALNRALRNSCITSSHTGFYFGIHAHRIRAGEGIAFGCSRKFSPSVPGEQWVYECDYFAPDLPSPAFTALYRSGVQAAGPADYVLAFGYLGLALRNAFQKLPTMTTLGGAPHRAVMWGFQEGDLAHLGIIRPSGLELQLCFDTDPDATATYVPQPFLGTEIGKYFRVEESFNHKQWHLGIDESCIAVWDLMGKVVARGTALGRPICLTIKKEGPPVPLSTLLRVHGVLVADAPTAALLRRLAPADFRELQVSVQNATGDYFIIEPLHGIPVKQQLQARHLVDIVDANAAGNHQVFVPESGLEPIVAAGLRDALVSAGIRSRRFVPILHRSWRFVD